MEMEREKRNGGQGRTRNRGRNMNGGGRVGRGDVVVHLGKQQSERAKCWHCVTENPDSVNLGYRKAQ